MYKMVVIDVDDTLLNDELVVTEGTKAALAEAVRRGVLVTLATGRMYASAKNIAKQIDLNVPLITYQGSLIKNLLDETVLYERSVPLDAAAALYEYCEKRGLHLQAYFDDRLYAQEENDKLIQYANLSKIPYTIEPDVSVMKARPSTKLIVIDDPEKLDRLTPEIRDLIGDRVHITKSKPNFLEFLHKEGTKGHAVSYLAGHIGCDLSEVIAIGDSWNDKEMLEVAGLGVAMGNAVQPLKDIADYVTYDNNSDGVKHVIEKFVLNAG